jgi:hypothetical protein
MTWALDQSWQAKEGQKSHERYMLCSHEKRIGGEVRLDSTLNVGTTFYICLRKAEPNGN